MSPSFSECFQCAMPAPARGHAHSRAAAGGTATRSRLTLSIAPSKIVNPVRTRQRPPSRTARRQAPRGAWPSDDSAIAANPQSMSIRRALFSPTNRHKLRVGQQAPDSGQFVHRLALCRSVNKIHLSSCTTKEQKQLEATDPLTAAARLALAPRLPPYSVAVPAPARARAGAQPRRAERARRPVRSRCQRQPD